ncbi:MAG: flagellar brake protein [Methylococcales bacterium]|jgi:c-di-GMP-binding flagellar brake protein YcgR|nr:flagellar brake protein [Methylococcales bacterium]
MSDDEMRLHIGDVLQLQPVTENTKRYKAKLIGFLSGKSMIITAPKVNKKPIVVREDQRFVVRVLSEGCVHGFQCSVLKSYSQPYAHMHLTFPKDITSVKVRQSQRVKLKVPAKAINVTMRDFGTADIRIIDLSTTGAKILAKQQIGQVGNKLEINTSVKIADMDEDLLMEGTIRNVDIDEGGYFYGIQFDPLDRHEVLVIHGFVLEHLVSLGNT